MKIKEAVKESRTHIEGLTQLEEATIKIRAFSDSSVTDIQDYRAAFCKEATGQAEEGYSDYWRGKMEEGLRKLYGAIADFYALNNVESKTEESPTYTKAIQGLKITA